MRYPAAVWIGPTKSVEALNETTVIVSSVRTLSLPFSFRFFSCLAAVFAEEVGVCIILLIGV